MRVAALGLQSDFDRQLPEFVCGHAAPLRLLANPQHVLFVDVEIHIDRVERHDSGKLRRRRRSADQFADRDEMGADDAVKRRDDVGVTVIDRRDPGVGLGLLQVGLRVVPRRGRIIERCLRDRLPLHQIGLALEIGIALPHRGLRAGFRGLRLFELQLVGFGLDREQRGAFLDEGAVLIIDRLQNALHARDEIDILDRRGIAGRLQIARDGPLHRNYGFNFRWWRRNKTILFTGT